MALSCSCDDYPDEFTWYWYAPDAFTSFKEKRRKRCVSCNNLIEHDADCLKFERYRWSYNEIEERIYGNEKCLAPWYLCEKCGEIWINLYAIGYKCIAPDETIQAQKEYWEITGFDPEKYKVAK